MDEDGKEGTQKIVIEEDITRVEKIGYNFDKMLRSGFEFWARNVVCRFPITTIVVSLAWSITLSFGLTSVEFTTGKAMTRGGEVAYFQQGSPLGGPFPLLIFFFLIFYLFFYVRKWNGNMVACKKIEENIQY